MLTKRVKTSLQLEPTQTEGHSLAVDILLLAMLLFQKNISILNLNKAAKLYMPYRTRSKNSSTLKLVRRKSFVQVYTNCDEFPVSPIPVISL